MSGQTATDVSLLDIKEEMRKVTSLINAARRLLVEGKMVDLAGLQRNVDILCQTLQQSPPKQSQAAQKSLVSLLDGLDTLAYALTAQFIAYTRQAESTLR